MVSKQLLLVLMALFFLQLSATSLARVEKMKEEEEQLTNLATAVLAEAAILGLPAGEGQEMEDHTCPVVVV
ncbi:hypothetical protein SASPL_104672 [Salvia splendens]|uniref:Uncharacterized protein n=1 Tax=Salvia splendens TaxID=180675 RepID=A0A8X8YN52_SALSN|nr:hypothetical protein SASPL_104672 [Salvia splendens]